MSNTLKNRNATAAQLVSGDVNVPAYGDKFGNALSNIYETQNFYRLMVPNQTVGSAKTYFDLFNAVGSGKTIKIFSVVPIVLKSAAVTGTLGVDLFLTRTTDIGTGGTEAVSEATTDVLSFKKHDLNHPNIPSGITARLSPAGGATTGSLISYASIFTEETSDAAYNDVLVDFIGRSKPTIGPLVVRENTGIKIQQGGITSVGKIAFDVIFSLE
jgi:hypothetical protein